MEFSEFYDIFEEQKRKRQIYFSLPKDKEASIEDISKVENELGVVLPSQYKDFVQYFGGGYCGLTKVYSCDPTGDFYILNHVTKNNVDRICFLPIIDLETGDMLGFKVSDGICSTDTYILSHDRNYSLETDCEDFFLTILKHSFLF